MNRLGADRWSRMPEGEERDLPSSKVLEFILEDDGFGDSHSVCKIDHEY